MLLIVDIPGQRRLRVIKDDAATGRAGGGYVGVTDLLNVITIIMGYIQLSAAVVGAFSIMTRLLRRQGSHDHGPWHSETLIRTPVAYAIGSLAAFWTVQRVAGFWA